MSREQRELADTLIRVLPVSDGRFAAECLRIAISGIRSFNVVAVAVPDDAIAKALEFRPDVMLMYFSSLDTALNFTRDAATSLPDVQIIVLGVPDGERNYLSCVEAGAVGWVPASASFDRLRDVIEAVKRGETACSPRFVYRLFERLAELASGCLIPSNDLPTTGLTARELEIVELIAAGKTNSEMAEHLHLSVASVKARVHKTLEKLRVRRSELSAANPLT